MEGKMTKTAKTILSCFLFVSLVGCASNSAATATESEQPKETEKTEAETTSAEPEKKEEETKPVETAKELPIDETITGGNWEVVCTSAEITTAIYPEDPDFTGNYLEVDDGKKIIDFEFDVKNLASDVVPYSDAINNVSVKCGSYNFNNYEMYYDMGSSISVTMLQGQYIGSDPLDTTHIYVVLVVADEAVEAGDVIAEITIMNQKYTYHF